MILLLNYGIAGEVLRIFENRIIGAIDFGGSNGDCVLKGGYDYGVFFA